MKLIRTIQASLSLLTRRDRFRLGTVTFIQMSTSALDLLGVLLLGLVTALAASAVAEVSPPSVVTDLLERLRLNALDPLLLAAWLAVAAGLVLIAKSLANMYMTRRILTFLANRQAMVSGRLASALLSRPLLQLQKRSSQETVYALTTGAYFATLIILGNGVVAISELTLLTVLAIGLLSVSPLVTVFTIVYFVAIGWLLQRLIARWAVHVGVSAADAEVRSTAVVQEALATYHETVVTHRRGYYVHKFEVLRWQAARVQADNQFLSLIPKYVFEAALVIGAALLAVSQFLTRDLTAAIAVIAVFLAAGSRIVPSMLRLHGSGLAVLASAGQADPTFQLAKELQLDEPANTIAYRATRLDPDLVRAQLEYGYPDFTPTVQAAGLIFSYPDSSAPAIRDVALSVYPGDSLAIVGSTGSGKSTLADLLLGIAQPDEGTVLIGGLPPLEAVMSWPGAIAYVPQDVVLANDSVLANVALGLPPEAIDETRVWEALDRAHLAAFLRDSRAGLETMVGEGGVRFSGGQRQRLGLARALYSRPKFLVLDEATSALDAETESAITATLRDLQGTVTTVTIAHRLATIRDAATVIYLANGRIIATGTFEEVRKMSGSFDRQARLLGL